MDNGFAARLVIGLFIVLLGLSLFFDQLGINFFGFNVFSLWPLILIFFGLTMLVRHRIVGGLFLMAIGSAFLLSNVFNFSVFAVLWPLIIIFIGISILFRPHRNWDWTNNSQVTGTPAHKDRINESIVFWSSDQVIKSNSFTGGKIDCVFGGFKLDLRDVRLSDDGARLELNSVFAGGELYLPKDIRFEVATESVMGGVSNHAVSSANSGDKLLRIKATAVFGGIEIRN